MNFLKWLDRNFELIIMGAAIVTITVIVFADVVGRSFFGTGITCAQELSRTCEIIIAAMGISYGVQTDKHIRVDLIQTFWPKTKKPLAVFGDIVVFSFCIFMSCNGLTKLKSALISQATTAVLEIPMFYIYLMMELGLVFAALRMVEKYVKRLYAAKKGGETA